MWMQHFIYLMFLDFFPFVPLLSRGGGTCSGVGGGGTGVRGHLTYKKRANQVQHKQQVIYSKHAVHLQLLIKSPIAINFKGKKVKTIFVF